MLRYEGRLRQIVNDLHAVELHLAQVCALKGDLGQAQGLDDYLVDIQTIRQKLEAEYFEILLEVSDTAGE